MSIVGEWPWPGMLEIAPEFCDRYVKRRPCALSV